MKVNADKALFVVSDDGCKYGAVMIAIKRERMLSCLTSNAI